LISRTTAVLSTLIFIIAIPRIFTAPCYYGVATCAFQTLIKRTNIGVVTIGRGSTAIIIGCEYAAIALTLTSDAWIRRRTIVVIRAATINSVEQTGSISTNIGRAWI